MSGGKRVTKDTLETCSDSIFAIVLTLLVLDLRVPLAHGPAGLEQIAPSLLVHAATFLLVGVFWMLHHGALARVVEVNTRTLTLNLLTLFWITLLPYGAKNAAERPLEPLGASLISACCGFHLLSMLAMRLSAHSTIDDNPQMKSWRFFRILLLAIVAGADLVSSVLSWVTPWVGYSAALATVIIWLAMPSPPEVEKKFQIRNGFKRRTRGIGAAG
jgi:uncharacterized membrane protein